MRKAESLKELDRILDSDPHELWRWWRKNPALGTKVVAPGFLRSIFGRKQDEESTEQGDDEDVLQDTIDYIAKSVAEAQAANAIQQSVESRLMIPEYLDSEPYLRLELRGTHQWWNLLNSSPPREPGNDEHGFGADALLLIHRSGVMELTLAMRLPDELNREDLVNLTLVSRPSITRSELPEPIMRAAARKVPESNWLGEWLPEISDEVRWRNVQYDPPASVEDIFQLYLGAIANAGKVELNSDWMAYPVVCIDRLGCCTSEDEWLSHHNNELIAIVSRMPTVENIRDTAIGSLLPPNASNIRDNSAFYNDGSTTLITWHNSERPDFHAHSWSLLVVEYAMLQYWQLRVLDKRLAATIQNQRKVSAVQKEAIYDLVEYRSGRLTYGSANDIVESMLEKWRAGRLYSRILEALDQLQQRVSQEKSLHTARRANVLTTVAAFVAIVLGLPAVDQSLEIALNIPQEGFLGYVSSPIRSLAEQGDAGAFKGYLAIISLIIIVALPLVLFRRIRSRYRTQRKRRSLAGEAWPLGTVSVRFKSEETKKTEDSAQEGSSSAVPSDPKD